MRRNDRTVSLETATMFGWVEELRERPVSDFWLYVAYLQNFLIAPHSFDHVQHVWFLWEVWKSRRGQKKFPCTSWLVSLWLPFRLPHPQPLNCRTLPHCSRCCTGLLHVGHGTLVPASSWLGESPFLSQPSTATAHRQMVFLVPCPSAVTFILGSIFGLINQLSLVISPYAMFESW